MAQSFRNLENDTTQHKLQTYPTHTITITKRIKTKPHYHTEREWPSWNRPPPAVPAANVAKSNRSTTRRARWPRRLPKKRMAGAARPRRRACEFIYSVALYNLFYPCLQLVALADGGWGLRLRARHCELWGAGDDVWIRQLKEDLSHNYLGTTNWLWYLSSTKIIT